MIKIFYDAIVIDAGYAGIEAAQGMLADINAAA